MAVSPQPHPPTPPSCDSAIHPPPQGLIRSLTRDLRAAANTTFSRLRENRGETEGGPIKAYWQDGLCSIVIKTDGALKALFGVEIFLPLLWAEHPGEEAEVLTLSLPGSEAKALRD